VVQKPAFLTQLTNVIDVQNCNCRNTHRARM